MKKILLILLLCLTAIAWGKGVGLPNPFVEVNTMDEASKRVGFILEVPTTYKDYKKQIIKIIENEMIEVTYLKEESNFGGFFIRKSKGTYDTSSNHKESKNVKNIKIGDYVVREQGDGENISIATWTDGTYIYLINTNRVKLNADDIANLVQNIK